MNIRLLSSLKRIAIAFGILVALGVLGSYPLSRFVIGTMETTSTVLADTGEPYVIKLVASLPEGEGYMLYRNIGFGSVGQSNRVHFSEGVDRYATSTVVGIFSKDSDGIRRIKYYYRPATNELFEAGKVCDPTALRGSIRTVTALSFRIDLPEDLKPQSDIGAADQGHSTELVFQGDAALCNAASLPHRIQIRRMESLTARGTGHIANDGDMEEYMRRYHPLFETFDNGNVRLFITGTSGMRGAPPYEVWTVSPKGNVYVFRFDEYFDNIENIKTILSTFSFLTPNP